MQEENLSNASSEADQTGEIHNSSPQTRAQSARKAKATTTIGTK